MKHTKMIVIGLIAALVVAAGAYGLNKGRASSLEAEKSPAHTIKVADFDLRDRIKIDPDAPSACVAVNLEGTIVEVAEDGLSFKLDNGKWIRVTETTEIGVTLPTAAAIEDQFLEPTFRVGNSIAGFALEEDLEADTITAYAIYTNWNWEDPIK